MSKKVMATMTVIVFGIIAIYGFNGQSGGANDEWLEKITWTDAGISRQDFEATGKPLFLFVSTEWCTFCKKIKASTFTDNRVQKLLNELFIAMIINPEQEGMTHFTGEGISYQDLAVKLGVTGYPTSFFFTPTGDIIGGQPGYIDKDQFAQLAEYVGDGHYIDHSFAEFQSLPDDKRR
jgi:thioredoxin-related protein